MNIPNPNHFLFADNSPTDRQARLRCVIDEPGIQNHAPTQNALASNHARRKCYASCRCSRCEQFVAGQRRSATSARTESSAREDACKRHLLHRRTSNARTLARTIPPNPRPRAGRRDRCRGSRRHHAKGRRPRGYRLDSIHLRALRMARVHAAAHAETITPKAASPRGM